MSEDRFALLEGLSRTRGFVVQVNDDTFELIQQTRRKSVPRSWELSEQGIENASRWLLGKPVKANKWWFR